MDRVGFLTKAQVIGPESLREDRAVAQALLEFARRFVGFEIQSTAFYHERPPFCWFAGLQSQRKYDEVIDWTVRLADALDKFEDRIKAAGADAATRKAAEATAAAMWRARNKMHRARGDAT